MIRTLSCAALGISLLSLTQASAVPAGTTFTYQGHLNQNGAPANGDFDMLFGLHDDAAAVSLIGSELQKTVTVTDGVFTVELDFGAVFDGAQLWLQIDVRPDGDVNPRVPLTPRQKLTATPFAIHALNGGGGGDGHSLDAADGDPVDALFVNSGGNVGIGTTTPGTKLTVQTAVGQHGFVHRDGTHNILTWLGTSEGTEGAWIGPSTAHSLSLQTSNLARMTITNDGNVGVGTTTPTAGFHLQGGPAFNQARIQSPDAGGTWLHLVNDDAGGTDWSLVSTGSGNTEGAGNLLFYDWSGGLRMMLDDSGRVGIGTDPGAAYLNVQPSSASMGGIVVRAVSPNAAGFGNQPVALLHAGPTDYVGTVLRVGATRGDSSDYALLHVNNAFATSSKLYVRGDGLVGIGTDAPAAHLHVSPTGTSPVTTVFQALSPAAASFQEGDVAVIQSGPSFGYTGSVLKVRARQGDDSSYDLLDVSNNAANTPSSKFYVRGDGAVGIGTSAPDAAYRLDVAGDIRCVALTETSSRSLKHDIAPIEGALEKVSRLQGVRFTWDAERGGKDDLGFVAEEVAKVLPELVSWEEEGVKASGLKYGHLTAVAVEAIKELSEESRKVQAEKDRQLAKRDAQIAKQQIRIDDLSARLERLERMMIRLNLETEDLK